MRLVVLSDDRARCVDHVDVEVLYRRFHQAIVDDHHVVACSVPISWVLEALWFGEEVDAWSGSPFLGCPGVPQS